MSADAFTATAPGALLVTGASGFVGLNVVEQALAGGARVVGLSAAPIAAAVADRLHRLPGRFVETVGDVRDSALLDALASGHGADRVLHMAAIVSVNLAGLAAVLGAAAARADAVVARAAPRLLHDAMTSTSLRP